MLKYQIIYADLTRIIMKIKQITYHSMEMFKLYMSIDKKWIYIVNKVHGNKNSIIRIYAADLLSEYPNYSKYQLIKELKVDSSENYDILTVIDFGKNNNYIIYNDKLIFKDIDKAYNKFKAFINNI